MPRAKQACAALGVQRIHLYQLHAPDPRTPLSTSVRALDALRNEGLIERVGLCNVNVGQIEEARRITDISAVQIELSLWHDTSLLNGVVQHCIEHGIQLIAYRPLGGSRRSRQSAFGSGAGRGREPSRRDAGGDRAGVALWPV